MSGLSAASWRLALVLVSMCRVAGSAITVEKPTLEALTGVTLNTVTKTLAPLMDTKIDLPGHPLDGEFVFENIQYDGGQRGKRVGQVRASITIAMGQFLAEGIHRTVSLPTDEIREYGSVASIILRLRLAAALEGHKRSSVVMRIGPADVLTLFGQYGRVAIIQRPSTVTGEVVEHISLARVGTAMIVPAIEEIARVSKTIKPTLQVSMDGRKWASIEIMARRLSVRALVPKAVSAYREIKIRPPGNRKVVVA